MGQHVKWCHGSATLSSPFSPPSRRVPIKMFPTLRAGMSAGSVCASDRAEAEVGPARVRIERSRQREEWGITEREVRKWRRSTWEREHFGWHTHPHCVSVRWKLYPPVCADENQVNGWQTGPCSRVHSTKLKLKAPILWFPYQFKLINLFI